MTHYFLTGASAGIGAALATRLCENGHRVSAVARRDDRLATMATKLPGFWSAGCDVTMANQLAESVAAAENAQGSIDVAILNAGIYQPQDGSAIDPAIYANHMDVNYMGVVNALAAIVPRMIARGGGHIVIISSVAGWRGLPKSAAYGPTKAAL
ncbi:MAG: SDR family NAD(P)-dependent oxidoreductase, partial [Candidatus Puniceispirillaceae bacterium]